MPSKPFLVLPDSLAPKSTRGDGIDPAAGFKINEECTTHYDVKKPLTVSPPVVRIVFDHPDSLSTKIRVAHWLLALNPILIARCFMDLLGLRENPVMSIQAIPCDESGRALTTHGISSSDFVVEVDSRYTRQIYALNEVTVHFGTNESSALSIRPVPPEPIDLGIWTTGHTSIWDAPPPPKSIADSSTSPTSPTSPTSSTLHTPSPTLSFNQS